MAERSAPLSVIMCIFHAFTMPIAYINWILVDKAAVDNTDISQLITRYIAGPFCMTATSLVSQTLWQVI
jgi:hypothetical protein